MAIRTAIIGAGGIGSIHLNTLKSNDIADIVAICDVSEAAAISAANPFDANVYVDHEDLIAEEKLDALIIAIPPFAHTNQETLAAKHGIDLFIEKPIALTRETVRKVDETIAESDVSSQVGHMYRYHEIVEKARRLIGDRDIALLDGHWIGGVPPSNWWGEKEKSGGQVVEQAAHLFDLVRYFGGEVEQVDVAGGKQVVQKKVDFEDAVSATMKHENGIVSHVSTSCAAPDSTVNLRIVGDGFSLSLEFETGSDNGIPRAIGTLTGMVDGEEINHAAERCAWVNELETFVRAVENDEDDQLHSPYSDAIKTFELTLKVNEAIESDESVPVQY